MDRVLEIINGNKKAIILALVIIAAIIVLLVILRNMLRKLRETFAEPIEVYKALKQNGPTIKELADRPKSVSGMDSVYLPMIAKDFPNINIDEFKKLAKDSLREVFNAIESQGLDQAETLSKDLRVKTKGIIEDHKSRDIVEHFDGLKFHNIVVSNYTKISGKIDITFQAAMQYVNYILDSKGELLEGDKDMHKQTRYNITMRYIQDMDKVQAHTSESALGINCPNCGAPVKTLGAKFCDFCGTGIVEINIKSWVISDYKEI